MNRDMEIHDHQLCWYKVKHQAIPATKFWSNGDDTLGIWLAILPPKRVNSFHFCCWFKSLFHFLFSMNFLNLEEFAADSNPQVVLLNSRHFLLSSCRPLAARRWQPRRGAGANKNQRFRDWFRRLDLFTGSKTYWIWHIFRFIIINTPSILRCWISIFNITDMNT